MNQKTPEYINSSHAKDPDSLFQDLESELDFGSVDKDGNVSPEEKRHPLQTVGTITDIFFKLVLLIVFISGIDSTIRNLDSTEYLSNLPICAYLTLGVDNYPNTECLSYKKAIETVSLKKETYEKALAKSLALLIPKKLLSKNVLAMPEVQFIEQKNTRVSMTRVFDKFEEIRKSTKYEGRAIECAKFSVSEKGDITTTCNFLGFGLSPGSDPSETSRAAALLFLDKLQDTGSSFQVLESPKNLDLEKFTSTDSGIRSTFSTQTVLPLKLRYTPISKP